MKISNILICFTLLSICGISSAAKPDSPFGIICPWTGVSDAGVGWVRVGASCTALDWGSIEKERGVYTWTDADAEVATWVGKEKLNLLPIFGYTPKWLSSGPKGDQSYPPKNLQDWSDFVYRMVSRYKGKVKYWEVWNEQNIAFFNGTIEQYSDLLKTAYVAAKKADPSCKVVFGGTAGVDIPYMEVIYGNGCGQYFDVMAVHPYQWGDTFNDDWFRSLLTDMHQLMVKNGDGWKEIWLTEFGWSTGDAGITEDVQARLLAQCLITSLTMPELNVTKAFWFSIKDWGGPGHGLLRDDGSRKPSFGAYRFVTQNLASAKYVKSLHQDDTRCHLFSVDGKPVLASWRRDKSTGTLKLPDGWKWTSIRRMDDTTRPLNGQTEVKVTHEPIFIIGEGKVDVPRIRTKPMPKDSLKRDVWVSVDVPASTTRLYVERGQMHTVHAVIHNDSPEPSEVMLTASIGKYEAEPIECRIESGKTRNMEFNFNLPLDFNMKDQILNINGTADGISIAPISMPIRVSDGPVVEFLANSFKETQYLVENNNSGGSPSTRFGGNWTYRIELPASKSASLHLDVGAHNAGEWKVSLSRDKGSWAVGASDRSNRAWHVIDVSAYAGGTLYIKFEGDNQQLRELILYTVR
ncbi:MAG: endo-1,4-beta-xylanase [Armatimonadota bacterium]